MNIKTTIYIKTGTAFCDFQHVSTDIVDAYKHIEAVVHSPLLERGTDETKTVFLEAMMQVLTEIRFGNKISFENWMLKVERMEEDPDEKQ